MTQNTQTTVDRLRDTLLPIEFDDLGKIELALEQFAAEIDRLTAERDEAQAMLLAEREAYSKRSAEQTIDGAVKLLTEELAEVERLRPAAEAWIAYDDYMMCPEEHEAEKFPVWVAAHKAAKSAQVARAAKERKP